MTTPKQDGRVSEYGTADDPVIVDVDSAGDVDDHQHVPRPTKKQSLRKIVIRVLVMAIGIGVAGVLLVATFDDLDLDAIIDALGSLDDAERLSLIGGTVILCWAEGLLMASFVQGMPARRGTLAWLGPTAVGSVVPGPSDVPFIFRMFRSWGQSSASAATAVAAASMFNIASKLILPAIAGIGVVVADIPLDGVMSTIVTAAVILAIFLIVAGIVLGSQKRTAAAGRMLDRVWRPTMRLLRRRPPDRSLADRLVIHRTEALALLRGSWHKSLAAITFVTLVRVALLVMSIRFVGVPESVLSWVAIFCVWAIVRGLTVIPLMPGGVGVSEVAYIGMLTAIAGQDYVNEVTAGVLVYRILTWLLMIPAGGVAMALWQAGLRKNRKERQAAAA
ncbi:MAG TPA: lysylphosphatidylglycerol synthase domain-containing protein [Ilumatobacter sp.]